jgi:hypothetical protein
VAVSGVNIPIALSPSSSFTKWSDIVNDHALEESFARQDKPRVILALLLVEFVIGESFEVQGRCIIERMVGDGTFFGRSGLSDESALKIGNLRQPLYLSLERGAVFNGKVLLQPKVGIVN